jgi:hypothetical protein
MEYSSPGGIYHEKDWSEHSFIIIGEDEPTLEFRIFDSTWISQLKIQEL